MEKTEKEAKRAAKRAAMLASTGAAGENTPPLAAATWANVGGLPVAVCVPMPTPVAMPNLERAAAELTPRQEGL